MAKQKETANVTPERQKVTPLQAERLAALTGLNAKEIAGNVIADLSEKFRWRVDPELFLFRRVCGARGQARPRYGGTSPRPICNSTCRRYRLPLAGLFSNRMAMGLVFPLLLPARRDRQRAHGCLR